MFWRLVLYYFVILSSLVTGPLGLLVIWFDPAVGIVSLIWFAISALMIFFMRNDPLIERSNNLILLMALILWALKRTNCRHGRCQSDVARPKSSDNSGTCSAILFVVLLVLAPVSAVTGLIWLIIDLIRLGHITTIPLLLLVLFVLAGAIWFGIYDFLEQAVRLIYGVGYCY